MTAKRSTTLHELEAILPAEMTSTGAESITIAGQTFVAEEARGYKVAEAVRLIFASGNEASIRQLISFFAAYFQAKDDAEASRADKQASLLPWLISESLVLLPHLCFDLLALLTIPNAELRAASRQPNGIKTLVDERRELFQWEATMDEVMQALVIFLPTLRLDALKNAVGPVLGRLVDTVQNVMGNGQSASSDASTSSPPASGN